MNATTANRGRLRRWLWGAGALALTGALWLASLSASSACLHKFLHGPKEPGHICCATLLEHHQVLAPDDGFFVIEAVVAGFICCLRFELRMSFPHYDYESPPGRAPPAPIHSPVG